MSLNKFFTDLIKKVEDSDVVTNAGTDKDGFYKPTRTILLRHLQLLKDLHEKPLAKKMVLASWEYVVEHLPPEWLVPDEKQDQEKLKQILTS